MYQLCKNSFEQASSKYEITGLLVMDFTCLNKNTILRFTCNSPTPKVTLYKCVGVFRFNVIMRKTAGNMAL